MVDAETVAFHTSRQKFPIPYGRKISATCFRLQFALSTDSVDRLAVRAMRLARRDRILCRKFNQRRKRYEYFAENQLMGHHSGTCVLRASLRQPLSPAVGAWTTETPAGAVHAVSKGDSQSVHCDAQ